MDRLAASFNAYDFFGYILCGGLLLAGGYWAFAGDFPPLSTAGTFGVIGLAYITGHAVQSLANLTTERALWWSSNPRHAAAVAQLGAGGDRCVLKIALARTLQRDAGELDLPDDQLFEMARRVLRHRGLDARAEVMDVMYGFCRGSTTSCALLVVVSGVAGFIVDDSWTRLGIAAGLFAAVAVLLGVRTRRFGKRLAERVIGDCQILS